MFDTVFVPSMHIINLFSVILTMGDRNLHHCSFMAQLQMLEISAEANRLLLGNRGGVTGLRMRY